MQNFKQYLFEEEKHEWEDRYGNITVPRALETLEGCPSYIKGHFDMSKNYKADSLEHGPDTIDGDFKCGKAVRSLRYGPRKIGGSYSCESPVLESLERSA